MDPKKVMYAKRGQVLMQNLKKRHFEAYYCDDRTAALEKALELIPEGASVGWGGAMSAQQIGLMDALAERNVKLLDRSKAETPQERDRLMKQCLTADVFLTGANALSLDGQMVNIDGNGNRVAAIVYGPDSVIVVAGMNKVCDTLEQAVQRARSVAAPANSQRFSIAAPCNSTGSCHDCTSVDCICNQILITRHCRPAGRIKFILVGEELGL
ncbi:MAG: lactate utilization protein [Candidatus Faecousia sp.]|nr:lactate utilization protein [Bacillota bacterium]MDY4754428.1 lactate utilization protein [Candidatus Faecousia sp.]MDY6160681.1 lactate utilization protein [Candidatus Faecousia sp.]